MAGSCRLRDFHPLWCGFPAASAKNQLSVPQSYNPRGLGPRVWPLPLSLATTCGITTCFLFLLLLRCFSSEGLRRFQYVFNVAPFGHRRIEGRLHLPAAFRSLPRPSSPPGAKASPMRPWFASVSCARFLPNQVVSLEHLLCSGRRSRPALFGPAASCSFRLSACFSFSLSQSCQ